jgi:hypothetical protein
LWYDDRASDHDDRASDHDDHNLTGYAHKCGSGKDGDSA